MCQALFWHKSSWDSTEQKMPEQEEFSQNMEHVLKQRANLPAQAVEQDPAAEKRREWNQIKQEAILLSPRKGFPPGFNE